MIDRRAPKKGRADAASAIESRTGIIPSCFLTPPGRGEKHGKIQEQPHGYWSDLSSLVLSTPQRPLRPIE